MNKLKIKIVSGKFYNNQDKPVACVKPIHLLSCFIKIKNHTSLLRDPS